MEDGYRACVIEPKLLAHRGLMDLAPENTSLSFEMATLYGFAGVELDVHLTSDNELVIIHDESTKRVGGKDLEIETSTLAQLRQVDLGNFWAYKLPFQSILTLEDFCSRFLKDYRYVNLELKTDLKQYYDIERRVAEVLATLERSERAKFVISSFNFKSLKLYNSFDKETRLAFLFNNMRELRSEDREEIESLCSYLNPYFKLYLGRHRRELDSYGKKYIL